MQYCAIEQRLTLNEHRLSHTTVRTVRCTAVQLMPLDSWERKAYEIDNHPLDGWLWFLFTIWTMALLIYKVAHLIFLFFGYNSFFKQNLVKIAQPYFSCTYVQRHAPPLGYCTAEHIIYLCANFIQYQLDNNLPCFRDIHICMALENQKLKIIKNYCKKILTYFTF